MLSIWNVQNFVINGREFIIYHTNLTFKDPDKEAYRKVCGKKKKMLVTSIFSFSYKVSTILKTNYLYFVICKYFNLDLSKILQFGKELTLYHTILTCNKPEF